MDSSGSWTPPLPARMARQGPSAQQPTAAQGPPAPAQHASSSSAGAVPLTRTARPKAWSEEAIDVDRFIGDACTGGGFASAASSSKEQASSSFDTAVQPRFFKSRLPPAVSSASAILPRAPSSGKSPGSETPLATVYTHTVATSAACSIPQVPPHSASPLNILVGPLRPAPILPSPSSSNRTVSAPTSLHVSLENPHPIPPPTPSGPPQRREFRSRLPKASSLGLTAAPLSSPHVDNVKAPAAPLAPSTSPPLLPATAPPTITESSLKPPEPPTPASATSPSSGTAPTIPSAPNIEIPKDDHDSEDDIPLAQLPRRPPRKKSTPPSPSSPPPAALTKVKVKSSSSTSHSSSLRRFQRLDRSTPAPAMPKVGDVFTSRPDLQIAASKAAYARGFKLAVLGGQGRDLFVVGCKMSVKEGGLPAGHRCPWRLGVSMSGQGKHERWKVVRRADEHNHAPSTFAEMGAWRPPNKPRRTSGAKKRSKPKATTVVDDGSTDEDSDESEEESSDSEEEESIAQRKVKRRRVLSNAENAKDEEGMEGAPRSVSTSSSSAPSRRRASTSLSTPPLPKAPPPLRPPKPKLLVDRAFLPTLTIFLTSLSPSLSAHAPLLLDLGLDSVDSLVALLLLDEETFDRFFLPGREQSLGGARSMMDMPPLDRAKLKSALKKGRSAIVEVDEARKGEGASGQEAAMDIG